MTDQNITVFNPYKNIQQATQNLTDETLNVLDERYINTNENVFNETINNLNVQNLNIASNGKLYFQSDLTEQTTAFNPITVYDNFKTGDNRFTGKNEFNNLNVIDNSNSSITSSSIKQSNTDLIITSKGTNSNIKLQTYNNHVLSNINIDQFGNFSGINDVNSNRVKTSELRLPDLSISIKKDSNNLMLLNNIVGGSIQLQTSDQLNTLNFLEYDSQGKLSGIDEMECNSVTTGSVKFGSTNVKMYQVNKDLIIDNNVTSGSVRIRNYKDDGGTSILTINQFNNISGVNDLNLNRLYFGVSNSIIHKTNEIFYIENKGNGGAILMRNYDNQGVLRQVIFDQFMNVSGINDLYVNRLYFGNTQFLPSDVTNLMTKNTQIEYVAESVTNSPQTRITVGSNQGIYFVPKIQENKNGWNSSISTGDNCIVSDNGDLVLTRSSSTKRVGIKVTQNQTILNNAQLDSAGLKFSDNTVQTTAITQTYINSLINTAISNIIPVGTIMAYGGSIANGCPAGFVWCIGEIVQINTYQNLFNVIGHSFRYGRLVYDNSFWLPDLRGAYLKGCGYGNIFASTTSINNVGDKQDENVGRHYHRYQDQGAGQRNCTTGPNQTSRGNTEWQNTSVETYNSNGVLLDTENRPNSIGINYIIKC